MAGGGMMYQQIAQGVGALGQGAIGAISAQKAARAQDEGIKEWQKHLDEIVSSYQEGFDPYWTFVDPLADPGVGGVTEDILLSLGQPSGGAGLRGGPWSQALSMLSAMGPDAEMADAVKAMGYRNAKEMRNAQIEWEEEQARFLEESEATRQAVREGRFAGYENLAQMLSDFPLPTRAGIESERGIQEESLYAEIARDRALEEARILEAANAGNYNPAGQLGQLSDVVSLMREQARGDAISRALGIITGQVEAAGGAIQGLQGGLLPAQQAGLNLAQMRSGALTSLGQIAANQAMSVNQLQAEYDTNALLAQIGFPTEYLRGQNEAMKWLTQGQSWSDAVGKMTQNSGSQNQQSSQPTSIPYSSPGSSSGPATSGTGWGNYLSYMSPTTR
jgi:hypothetical protein